MSQAGALRAPRGLGRDLGRAEGAPPGFGRTPWSLEGNLGTRRGAARG